MARTCFNNELAETRSIASRLNCSMCSGGGNGPSNETLLSTAFLSFLIFTIVQLFAALFAKSQSMLTDTAAMFVDIFSYALNWCAERRKANATRKQQLQLELVAPLFSVCALLGVTLFSTKDAILVLIKSKSFVSSSQPNLFIMLLFSSLNLGLDVLNVTCFARAKKLFGFQFSPESDISLCQCPCVRRTDNNSDNEVVLPTSGEGIADSVTNDDLNTAQNRSADIARNQPSLASSDDFSEDDCNEVDNSLKIAINESSSDEKCPIHEVARIPDVEANLNMCSAYTHIFADTLRSIAVLTASLVAMSVDTIHPNQADAVARLAISFLIFLTVLPLTKGLFLTWKELQNLIKQETTAADSSQPQ